MQSSNLVSHSRANNILLVNVLLLILAGGLTLYIGLTSGELNKKIINPIKVKAAKIYKEMTIVPTPYPVTNYQYHRINSESSSSSTINIEQDNIQPTGIPVNSDNYNYNNYNYVYVTPTPNPTLVQWNKDFQQKWDQMQKDYEESKQKVCAQVPDAPGCH